MTNIKIMGICLSLWLTACALKSHIKQDDMKPDKYKGDQIIIGNGGGFMGKTREFCLLDNGSLWKKEELDSTFKKGKKLSIEQTKVLFANVFELNMDSLQLNEPANMYYFTKHRMAGVWYEAVWNKQSKSAASLKKFHASFFETTNPENNIEP